MGIEFIPQWAEHKEETDEMPNGVEPEDAGAVVQGEQSAEDAVQEEESAEDAVQEVENQGPSPMVYPLDLNELEEEWEETKSDEMPNVVEPEDSGAAVQEDENAEDAVQGEESAVVAVPEAENQETSPMVYPLDFNEPEEEWEETKAVVQKEEVEDLEESEEDNSILLDSNYLQGYLDALSSSNDRFAELVSKIQGNNAAGNPPPEPEN